MGKGISEVRRVAPVQVTTWGSSTDEDLLSWFPWYKKRGVPAAIIHRRGVGRQTEGTSVWRYGNDYGTVRDHFSPEYDIVEECHGFSKLACPENVRDAT